MKKEIKVVAIVLVALVIFLAGFGIGSSKGINVVVKHEGTVAEVVATTQATTVATTVATTEATTVAVTEATTTAAQTGDTTTAAQTGDTTTEATTTQAAETGSSIPSTPAEVVAKYNEVVNAAKKATNITIHKYATVNLECTSCSLAIAKPVVNAALPVLAKPTDWTRTYVDGKHTEGDQQLNDVIPPSGKECLLTEGDVSTATATANADGSYEIKLVIKAETSTFKDGNTVNPVSHEKAMSPLNLATLELPIEGASITDADMNYPGATCEASVGADGRLTKLHIYLPMDGEGSGGYKGMSLSVGIAGDMDDSFEITY